jgi:hypothetical protein
MGKKMRKAIVMTVFNRDEYLNKTLKSWSRVKGLQDYDFYIKLEPSRREAKIISIIEKFQINHNLNIKIIKNKKQLGVLVNPWDGLDKTFESGYDFVVLAEDDIEVSDDILHYFNVLSEKHYEDPEVMAICASSYHLWKDSQETSYYEKKDAFCPLIWGTWKDRWEKYLRDSWDKDYSTGENGVGGGWDWNIYLRVLPKYKMKCIYPFVSRSRHIGKQGVHMLEENYNESVATSFKEHNDFVEYEEIDATL